MTDYNYDYGVKITNKFSIIDESADPSEILNQLEKAAAALKSSSKDDKTKKKQQQAKKPTPVSESAKKLPVSTPSSGSDKQKTTNAAAKPPAKKLPAGSDKQRTTNVAEKPPRFTDQAKKLPVSAPYGFDKQKSTANTASNLSRAVETHKPDDGALNRDPNEAVVKNDGFGGFPTEENDENSGRFGGGGGGGFQGRSK